MCNVITVIVSEVKKIYKKEAKTAVLERNDRGGHLVVGVSVKNKKRATSFGDPDNNGSVNICDHGRHCEAGRCQKLERVKIPDGRVDARSRSFRDRRRHEGETGRRNRSESMA